MIGENGTGKTTMLKIINRQVSKDAGMIRLGSRVKIGYYDQEQQVLHDEKSIFQEISDAFPALNNTASEMFSPHFFSEAKMFSNVSVI